jgi:putative peptidoglycan lipid II flippase
MSATRTGVPPGSPRLARRNGKGGEPTRVAAAAGIMIAAIFLSRILGLVRDMVVSYYFGATAVTDAYKAAFRLPDLFYYLIAGGALSSAFIPVFTEYLTRGKECAQEGDQAGASLHTREAWHVFSIFGTLIFSALSVIVVLGEILTVPLLHWFIAPGFHGDQLQLTANLTRIIFPAQLCFFLGGLMMGTLYARKHFLMPALGPVVYNAAIIAGGIVGGALYGRYWGVYGLAVGVIAGAFIGNILMQVWAMRRIGVQYSPSFDYRHPGVVKVVKLMLPVLLGLSLPQLHLIIACWFASFLRHGTITWLDNANKVMQMPLGIFGQALAVAIFPTLSTLAAARDYPGLRKSFSLGLRSILFLTVPSSVLIIVLARPLIQVLFQRGLWTQSDTEATAVACILYSLSIFAVSGQQIVNRAFYALQDTVTPMVVGTMVTVLYVALNWLLMRPPLDQNGLAIAFSVCNIFAFLALLRLYRQRLGGGSLREVGTSLIKVCVASGVMGAAACAAMAGTGLLLGVAFHPAHSGRAGGMIALAEVGVAAVVSVPIYLFLVWFMRVSEAEFVFDAVRQRLPWGRR